MEDTLKDVYYSLDSPACFAGAAAVFREAHRRDADITRKDVQEFLAKQRTYTLYRPAYRKFKRLKTVPSGLDSDWQADLAMMNRLQNENDGYLYFLTCIDVLSRKIYAEPVRNKSVPEMKRAFNAVFERAGTHPLKICTDSGTEFCSRAMKQFFEGLDIVKLTAVTNELLHATMAERANRTIKDRLYKYFSENNTVRWVDALQRIVSAINSSVCRSTGMRPIDVNHNNSYDLKVRLYGHHYEHQRRRRKPKFKEGDHVRLLKMKTPFVRGLANYTDQIFTVADVFDDRDPVVYKIKNYFNRPVKGYFYERELVQVPAAADTTTRVERIIRWRNKRGGGREALVRWFGHEPEFDSWVDENEFNMANNPE